GRSVLVFSQFTRMLDRLAADLKKHKIPHIMLTGASKNRGALVKRFQDGEVPVFLISLKAGGTGLNLTRADTVIHYDPWWNSAAEAQATDRAYRIGQTRPVFVYKLLAENTVEEKIHALQLHKRELLQQIYNVAEAKTQKLALDNAALLALLD
ncbi:DEAD/DEAH box helicase, partial [Litorivivens sp.]